MTGVEQVRLQTACPCLFQKPQDKLAGRLGMVAEVVAIKIHGRHLTDPANDAISAGRDDGLLPNGTSCFITNPRYRNLALGNRIKNQPII